MQCKIVVRLFKIRPGSGVHCLINAIVCEQITPHLVEKCAPEELLQNVL